MKKAYVEPTLLDNLRIQYQVVRALMLRQILLRWGRDNLGFLWLFLEPLIMISVIVGFFSLVHGSGFQKSHFGILAVPFVFLGVSQAWTWRNISHRCAGAFSGNIPLLEHRFIRPFDLFVSAAIVELISVTAAFILIYLALFLVGFIEVPKNTPLLIMAWVLLLWFSFSYGILFGAISGAFDVFDFIMRGVNILFYIVSGVFFSIAWLPQEYREIVLFVPMIHGTEMMRHAYFGDKLETFENPAYLIAWNVFLSFLALFISRSLWLEDIRE